MEPPHESSQPDLPDNLLQLLHQHLLLRPHLHVAGTASLAHLLSPPAAHCPSQPPHLSAATELRSQGPALCEAWPGNAVAGVSLQTSQTSSVSAWSCFTSLSFVWSLSSTSNFLQELFFCSHNLAVWCKSPPFQSVSAFDLSSSLNLVISSF